MEVTVRSKGFLALGCELVNSHFHFIAKIGICHEILVSKWAGFKPALGRRRFGIAAQGTATAIRRASQARYLSAMRCASKDVGQAHISAGDLWPRFCKYGYP
jgi:hypothetical protein